MDLKAERTLSTAAFCENTQNMEDSPEEQDYKSDTKAKTNECTKNRADGYLLRVYCTNIS